MVFYYEIIKVEDNKKKGTKGIGDALYVHYGYAGHRTVDTCMHTQIMQERMNEKKNRFLRIP